LKITNISTRVVNARMRNWIFVKVETDRPGLYGWGEATLEWKTKAVVGAIQDLSQLLIGQDPRRVEHCWQIMHRQYFWRGGIINSSAMAGRCGHRTR
jgi:galactonate dehydratase